jgi:hypothetical protein
LPWEEEGLILQLLLIQAHVVCLRLGLRYLRCLSVDVRVSRLYIDRAGSKAIVSREACGFHVPVLGYGLKPSLMVFAMGAWLSGKRWRVNVCPWVDTLPLV